MMTREEQIAFMEGCQDRLRGYVSNWMRDPFFRGAFHHRREEPQDPAPSDNHEQTDARRFG
jgi:hypothetical protein